MDQYIFSVIVLLVFGTIYILLRSKLNIEKKDGIMYTHINKVHKILELGFIIIATILLFLLSFVFNDRLESHYFIGMISILLALRAIIEMISILLALRAIIEMISILLALRAIIEWKLKRESKEYILTILSSIALFS